MIFNSASKLEPISLLALFSSKERFASCLIEKGWKIEGCQIEISNGSDVSDESDDDDGEELDIGDIREIVKQSGILEVIEPGNYIASYLLT